MTVYSKAIPSRPLFQTAEEYNTATPGQGRLAAFQQGWNDTFFSSGAEYGAKLTASHLGTDGHLSQEEAKQRLEQRQLEFDIPEDGINSRALGIMMKRQYKRKLRDQTIAASGIGGLSQFTFNMLGSIPDPINLIAWPFAPEAAAIRGASTMARVGSRVGKGAAIGVGTAAAFEVPYAAIANALGDDYTMMDSLMNVTFGGIIGGGFHVIGRGINDIRNPYHPPLPEVDTPTAHPEVMQVALAQELSGRSVDVDASLRRVEDDLDQQILRALHEGDRAEARRLSEMKKDMVHRETGDPGEEPIFRERDNRDLQAAAAVEEGSATWNHRAVNDSNIGFRVTAAEGKNPPTFERVTPEKVVAEPLVEEVAPEVPQEAVQRFTEAAPDDPLTDADNAALFAFVNRTKATKDLTLYRGTAQEAPAGSKGNIVSTSKNRKIAEGFGRMMRKPGSKAPVPLTEVLITKGARAADIEELGTRSVEQEVLITSKDLAAAKTEGVRQELVGDVTFEITTKRIDPEKPPVTEGPELGPQARAAKEQADLETDELRKIIVRLDEDLADTVDDMLKIADAEIEEADVFSKAFREAATCAATKGRP